MTAELLRLAANRIEQLAGEALGGTWEFHLDRHPEPDPSVWRDSPVEGGGMYVGETFHGNPRGIEHARWIATLGPQIAVPLIELLRSAADDLDATTRNLWGNLTPEQAAIRAEQEWFRRPLALARAILGETS